MAQTTARYSYSVMIDNYRAGQSDDAWRNQDDDTYFAVGLGRGAESLQGAIDEFAEHRQSEYGRQYARYDLTVYRQCADCTGSGKINGTRKPIRCPMCKGHETRETLFTLREYASPR